MSLELLPQLGEVIGISAIVSASISFGLEQLKFKKERLAARQEAHLQYSVQNYPNFASVLTDVTKSLFKLRNLYIQSGDGKILSKMEEFDDEILNLIYWLARLSSFEEEFKAKQGQIFRLASQSAEILIQSLYDGAKASLGLTRNEEIYLAQIVRDKDLKGFRKSIKKDPAARPILEEIRRVITLVYPEKFARKNLDTLSRLLVMEIQSIKLPGYERKPINLSIPDQKYITAFKRVPTLFFSNSSLDDYKRPIRVWVYNHWDHVIRWERDEMHMEVTKEVKTGEATTWQKVAALDIIDPNNMKKRSQINPGETLMAEWNRKAQDGNYAGAGYYAIIYLPRSDEDSRSKVVLTL